jgi:uncharacterized protein (TIGR02145 family)
VLAGFILIISACKKDKPIKPAANTGTVTDIDGNKYNYVTIGTQVWMTSNLRVAHYRNGNPIVNGATNMNWERPENPGAFLFANGDAKNDEAFGKIYNIQAVRDARKIAPVGWHIPTDEEWKVLEVNQGMSRADADDAGHKFIRGNIGKKLLTGGSSGLNLQLNGYFQQGNKYQLFNEAGFYWTSTVDEDDALQGNWLRAVNFGSEDAIVRNSKTTLGFSIRCIKD